MSSDGPDCKKCGGRVTGGKVDHPYTESGLSRVVLVGVVKRTCKKCGAWEVAVPRMEALHTLLARLLAGKHRRLAPEELRFLRAYLERDSQMGSERALGEVLSEGDRPDAPESMVSALGAMDHQVAPPLDVRVECHNEWREVA